MERNISVDSAEKILYSLSVTPKTETVLVLDACNRVLARDITAEIPVPPFDRSPFDGYAFRGEDTEAATRESPAVLKITEEIPAGSVPSTEIKSGYAAKILTGAPIPAGANATIKYELTEFSDAEVRIFERTAPDTDIVRAGEDVNLGDIVAKGGSVISPPVMGSVASQGMGSIEVFKRPFISIINTGSELCEVGESLRPAAIYNSNVYTLSGYLSEMGAAPLNRGTVPDEPEAIAARIKKELEASDMVITTGGASVGDYDWAVTAAEIIGAEILFWKVNMKPGGAIVAAVKDDKLILSLSGNPAAAVLGLFRIASPYIKKLCGRTDCAPKAFDALLTKPSKKSADTVRLLRGKIEIADSRLYFAENDKQGRAAVSSFIGGGAIAELPKDSPPLPAGATVRVYQY